MIEPGHPSREFVSTLESIKGIFDRHQFCKRGLQIPAAKTVFGVAFDASAEVESIQQSVADLWEDTQAIFHILIQPQKHMTTVYPNQLLKIKHESRLLAANAQA